MYTRPRRTTENDASALPSATKPSRISRLPKKRSASEERKTSMDTLTMHSRPKRANSVYSTPQRTPLRSTMFNISGAPTPGDRKQINEFAARIVDTLREQSCFGQGFLPQGLRSMSTKQFMSVMAFFMKSVLGNARSCRLTTEKLSVEEVTKFLADVGYPSKQTMSWMKTPNAPHAFNNLVELLQWLCIFIAPQPDTHDTEHHTFEQPDNLLDIDKCFPSTEYIGLFLASTKDNFSLWNNQQSVEFEHSKSQLVDTYIQMRTNVRGKAQIELEIDRNKREYEGQLQKRFVVREQKELNEKLAKEEHLERDLARLHGACKLKKVERDQVHKELHQQEILELELSQKLANLERIIGQQTVSRADRERMIVQLNKQRQLLDLRKGSANQLKDMGLSNQVQFARSLTQQNELAARYNHLVHEEFLRMSVNEWYGIAAADLSINLADMGDLRAQLDRIVEHLTTIRRRNTDSADTIRAQIAIMGVRLRATNANHVAALQQRSDTMEKCALLERQLTAVETEMLAERRCRQRAIDCVTNEMDAMLKMRNAKQIKLESLDASIVNMRNDNEIALQVYERDAEELLRAKRARQEQRRAAVDALNAALAALLVDLNASPTKTNDLQ